jgi:lysophosphatidylcholine acyltransferase/lyso-PAF acetyltransferase
MSWMLFSILYGIVVFIYSYWFYKKNYVYYKPFKYVNSETLDTVDVHKLYPEFRCLDKLSFLKIFIGNYFFSSIKFIINVFLAIMQIIRLKQHSRNLQNPSSNSEEWKIVSETISFWTTWLLRINGIKIIRKNLPYEEVYKKYLGEDYSFDPNERYSLIISNHTGFYDIVMNMSINSAGFLSKDETKKVPFVGTIAKGINCLFVKRENAQDRARIFEELEQRQRDFYAGNILSPLCIFPEGTTTNGKYILKFKKGAFFSLLPLKPQIILLGDNLDYSVAIGVCSTALNYFRSLCYCGCNMYLCELPVIKPTKYMFEHYSDLGTEKWEVFAEVTRKIMCEISGLTPSDKTFRDSKKYENSLIKGTYHEESADLFLSNEIMI